MELDRHAKRVASQFAPRWSGQSPIRCESNQLVWISTIRFRPTKTGLPFAALDGGFSADTRCLILKLWRRHRMNIFTITRDLKQGFELGTRLLVFDKRRLDSQAPRNAPATGDAHS